MSAESSLGIQTVEQKLNVAKQKKETADQAFKLGNVKDGEPRFVHVLKDRNRILSAQLSGPTTR